MNYQRLVEIDKRINKLQDDLHIIRNANVLDIQIRAIKWQFHSSCDDEINWNGSAFSRVVEQDLKSKIELLQKEKDNILNRKPWQIWKYI